ncbi:MAG: hypothetical protein ACD_82C00078G0001 [uncultured bacterium]|nr:MAG: hypothetical protein ACD_82C00078G0001 [uncultured bacterium]
MKKHLLILSTLVLVSGKIFAADGSVSVENQTGKNITIKIKDSINKIYNLGRINSDAIDASKYEGTGELIIKNKHQWKIPTLKTERTVSWTVDGNIYETKEAYNPLDGIVIYDNGETYSVKKSALGSFSKKIDSKVVEISKQKASKTKPKLQQEKITKLNVEISTLNKDLESEKKKLKDLEKLEEAAKEKKAKENKKYTRSLGTSSKIFEINSSISKIEANIKSKEAELKKLSAKK